MERRDVMSIVHSTTRRIEDEERVERELMGVPMSLIDHAETRDDDILIRIDGNEVQERG